MTILQSIILGIIQGVGEFLPISSSGHLLLAQILMDIDGNADAFKVFDILLHVGTLLPVAIIFWKDWVDMLMHPIKNKTLLYLFLASLPTLIIYVAAKKLFPAVGGFSVFDSGWFLGCSFLITAVFLTVSDTISSKRLSGKKEVSLFHAIVMGFFQGIGLIQGVSRSGSTISGGLFCGLDKKVAARFSFMMSAPAIVGSLLMEGKDALETGLFSQIEIVPVVIGIIVAALAGYVSIRWMLRIIEKVSLRWFALYTALLGTAILILQLAGSSLVPAFTIIVP